MVQSLPARGAAGRRKKMGTWMSLVWFLMFPAKKYKIVVVGLDDVAAKGLGARWVVLLAAMAEGRGARGTPSTTARHRHHLGHHLSRVPISTRYGGGQICGRKAVGDCLLGAGGSEASGKRDGG
ncbi:hypothetical protein DAI22_10g047300 [Oryza sativa Japonica Group]|nr:hypothetical protein DAI22_10g047300 [Oryza sativa Japonica Group]